MAVLGLLHITVAAGPDGPREVAAAPATVNPTTLAARAASTTAGSVWAWGDNHTGQLGDGTMTNRASPVRMSALADVKAVAAGQWHGLAVKSDGGVWAWGLGAATSSFCLHFRTQQPCSLTPVQVSGLSDITAVAAGGQHSLALKADGTVWAWGGNSSGQLGDGTTSSRDVAAQVSGLSEITAVAAGGGHSLALKSDGMVWAWGSNSDGQLGPHFRDDQTCLFTQPCQTRPVQVLGPYVYYPLSGVTAIAAGSDHSLALQGTQVFGWGSSDYGRLGCNQMGSVFPIFYGATAVSGGMTFTLALKSDGTAWAWGWWNSSQNPYGPLICAASSVLSEVNAIAAGGFHSLALKSDRTVWAVGEGSLGQLGDGTSIDRDLPVQTPGLTGVVAVAAGLTYSLAIVESAVTPTAAPTSTSTSTPTQTPASTSTRTATPTSTPNPSAIGLLRVYSDPVVATTIKVSGVARNDWGLDWLQLPAGDYTLGFGDVRGFLPPSMLSVRRCNPSCGTAMDQAATSPITVRAGETTEVRAPFTAAAFLRATSEGSGSSGPTISVDGQPANEWGAWVAVEPGSHTVGFETLAGLAHPCDRTVTIFAGATTRVHGHYGTGSCDVLSSGLALTPPPAAIRSAAATGLLRLYSDPAVAATVKIDGSSRNDWGLDWLKLPPGDYTLAFRGIEAFSAPTALSVRRCNPNCGTATDQPITAAVAIRAGETTEVRASFAALGFLRATTEGYGAGSPTISIDGNPANEWGAWVAVPAGTYSISFESLPGLAQPCSRSVTVAASATVRVHGNYTTGGCDQVS